MQAAFALPTSPQPLAANAGRQPADVTLLNLIAAGDEGARAQTGSAIYTVPLGAAASDDALIDAIADDDRHAFEVLYSRHSTGVYRFALRFVADVGIAEDVMNEVFCDVWRKAKSFEGRSRYRRGCWA